MFVPAVILISMRPGATGGERLTCWPINLAISGSQ